MLVGSVIEQTVKGVLAQAQRKSGRGANIRRLARGAEERGLARLALNVHGLFIGLELRLGRSLGLLCVALPLLRRLVSL